MSIYSRIGMYYEKETEFKELTESSIETKEIPIEETKELK